MARILSALFLAGAIVLTLAPAAGAEDWDRYERYGGPPPKQPAPPPPPRPVRVAVPHGGPYLFGSVGLFEPNDFYADYYGNTGLSAYDSGLSANLAIGSRVSPFGAIEATVGYFSAESGANELSVVPVTVGGRLIIPHPTIEPYIGGGIGFYMAELKEVPGAFGIPGYAGTDDTDTTLGGYFSMGLDMWLNPRAAINLEGRYQFAETSFLTNDGLPFDVDVSGWMLNLGLRLSF